MGQSLVALVSVLIGGSIAAIATWMNTYLSAASSTEAEKYRQRLVAYQELWRCTKQLRRTPDPEDMDTSALHNTIHRLDDWYFAAGGLLLSNQARHCYFALVDEMLRKLDGGEVSVSSSDYTTLYDLARDLRAVTAHEVGGRSRAAILRKSATVT